MRKRDEIGNINSCLNKARSDELIFVLLARDPVAAATVRYWANERMRSGKNTPLDAEIMSAFAIADAMEKEGTK